MPAFSQRICESVHWRFTRICAFRDTLLARLGPRFFVSLRWPWPIPKPWQRKRLLLSPSGGGIGDTLMCTPILAEIKRRNPDCQITFLTKYPALLAHCSSSITIEHYTTPRAKHATRLAYDHLIPPHNDRPVAHSPQLAPSSDHLYQREPCKSSDYPCTPNRPLITVMAECVGLYFASDQLTCGIPKVSADFTKTVALLGRPLVVVQTCAGDWTPNKDWPASHWVELIGHLGSTGLHVVEAGTQSPLPSRYMADNFRSLVCQTTIEEFAYVISQATVFIGPVSGGMHLANAYKIPSVIIYGGYESPDGHLYRNAIALASKVPCAPCWLTTPCPYNRACLQDISPRAVYEAVLQHLHATRPTAHGGEGGVERP